MSEELEFDPLAPIQFEPSEDDGYYVEYIPPIEKPEEDEAPVAAQPEAPVTERFARTVKGMPGQKKLLYHVVEWCRDERIDADVVAEITRFQGAAVSVYAPETVLAQLVACGALVCTNPRDDEPAQQPEAPGASVDTPAAEPENPADDAPVDAVTLDEDYLTVDEPEAARYVAHEEALAVVAADDPLAAFAQVVDTKPYYVPLFVRVLVACDDELGATKKHIDALVDNDPICASPRVFSGYFVDKLEAAGAIEFTDAWHTTEAGRSLLAEGGLLSQA